MLHSIAPNHAARLLVTAARNAGTLRELGDLPGHEFHGNQYTDEAGRQDARAKAQINPLAHPDIVIGGSSHPDVKRYVAAYGEQHTAAPLPADVERGAPKECYRNASLLVMERPDLTYAEGYATTPSVSHGLTFMHAWAVTKDGTVVDPTWDHPEKNTYFGVRYNRREYLKYLYTAKIYGVLGSTSKNVKMAVTTGAKKLRSAEFNPDQARDEYGRWTDTGSSSLSKTSADFSPFNPAGRDTREMYADVRGRYTRERQALHREIIEQHLHGTTSVAHPVATILGGGPASGKSTIVESEKIVQSNTVHVDVDNIRSQLPEYKERVGKDLHVSTLTHEESSDIAKQIIRQSIKTQRNIVLDGTGDSSLEKLGGKVAAMRAGGHRIEAHYVTVDVDTAVARARLRGDQIGRYVPESYIREIHAAVSRTFPEAVRQSLFDKAELYDTHNNGKLHVASARGKTLTIHNQAAWDRFLAKGAR